MLASHLLHGIVIYDGYGDKVGSTASNGIVRAVKAFNSKLEAAHVVQAHSKI